MPQIEDILIALNRSMVDDGKLLHRRYNRIMLVHWLKRALLCCTSFLGKRMLTVPWDSNIFSFQTLIKLIFFEGSG